MASLLIRLLSLTLRYRIHVAEETRKIVASKSPIIFAFWHGRMLIMPPLYRKVCGKEGKDAWIMVSQHLDGELIARTVKPFRIFSSRGSSTRGGRKALQELVEKVREGHTVGITPDGPAGPRYCVQPGVVRMAQWTGAPIVPLTWAARPRWVASSWDHFQVPVPFARTSVIFDEPFFVPTGESATDLETQRGLLERRLREVTDRMEAEAEQAGGGGWLSAVRTALQDFWNPSIPKGSMGRILSLLLAPLSFFYGLTVGLRRRLYRKGILRKRRVASPVISVGGLRVGGSGKTPFALWLARRLSEQGSRVVLLTRGYGRRKKQGTILLTRNTLPEWSPVDCGDEPYLLAQSLPDVPVAVDGDRYRAASLAEEKFSPDLFVMDDGFQHLRLARDFDIVLVPEDEDLYPTACLPRGPLREPPAALKDADVVVRISSPGDAQGVRRATDGRWRRPLEAGVPVHTARVVPRGLYRLEDRGEVDPKDLAGRRVAAFCGIARPTAFWKTLDGIGLKIECRRHFPDHHPYTEQDHEDLLRLLSVSDCAVTTEKDAVKISRYRWPAGKIFFLRLDLVLDEERAFWARLEAKGILRKRNAGKGEQPA